MSRTVSLDNEKEEMNETENDVSLEQRKELCRLMNKRLATAVDLQMQLKQAHWNVKGPSFIALHELFDSVYAKIEVHVDTIAERIVQFGGIAHGTIRASAKATHLAEYPLTIQEGSAHIEAVARALSVFGTEVRNMIGETVLLGDAGTADLFTEISRSVDKQLWFVEAHSQASS